MVELKDVTLEYELHGDKTNNIKEFIINRFRRGKQHEIDRSIKFHKALDQINFTFQIGERVGIIGKNGSGKSTLLKVLSGILKPTKGVATVGGQVQPLIELGAGFDPEISGRENIYLNSYMLGFTKSDVKVKEQEIIDFADLGKYIDIPVKYYSSGMLVRLAFTIATSIHPEILIIDEMLGAGDLHFLIKAEERISQIINKAKIVIVVSHDMGFIERICDRALLLEQGQIIFDGLPTEAIQLYSEG